MAMVLPHLLPESAAPEPKRWTVAEFIQFADANLLGPEGERYELLDGEILKKMGQNLPHISSIMLVADALRTVFGRGFIVNQQLPLHLGEIDAPEPDVTVIRGKVREYTKREVAPADLALVIEVADTRQDTARGRKVKIYARHGIQEYWLVDLRARTLEVFRQPLVLAEDWAEKRILGEGESIAPIDSPNSLVPVADLLP